MLPRVNQHEAEWFKRRLSNLNFQNHATVLGQHQPMLETNELLFFGSRWPLRYESSRFHPFSTAAGAIGGAPLPPLEPVLLLISTRCSGNPKQTLLAPFSFGDPDQWTCSRLIGN